MIGTCASIAAGCGGGGGDAAEGYGGGSEEPTRLVVSAAASMTEALEACAPRFEDAENADVKLSFAGSDELAAQIRQDAKADAYAAANTRLPDELHADGLLGRPLEFATNELVLAVPDGSEIDSPVDLTEPDTKLVIGSESVPIGSYTRETLAKLPASQEEAILANVRSEEPDVKGIVGKLAQGAADAGFVYVTDVLAVHGDLESDRVARPPGASGDLRRGGREQGFQAGSRGHSSAGTHRRRLRRRATGGRVRAGAVRSGAWFPVLLGLCLATVLTFLTLPIVAIFVDSSPADLAASLAEGRPRRALAEPADHRDIDRDHPDRGHAGGLRAGDAQLQGRRWS